MDKKSKYKVVRAQKKSKKNFSGWTTYYRIATKIDGVWTYTHERSSRKLAEELIDKLIWLDKMHSL